MAETYHLGRHSVYRHWSPRLGDWAARISKWNDSGEEFFAIVPHDGGKAFRRVKEEAIMAIDEAIDRNMFPGEVHFE